MGDPTLYELYLLASDDFMANPKSAIFTLFSLNRMLAGLRSLWMILLA